MLVRRHQSSSSPTSRSYCSSSGYVYTPPTPISISVDNCMNRPGFGERFSYCRYTTNPYSTTYYAYNPSMSILEDNRSGNLSDSFSIYMAKKAVQPRYGFNIQRCWPASGGSADENPDRAVSSYQLRNLTPNGGAWSKYWQTPRYWEAEREKARAKAHSWTVLQRAN